MINLQGWRSTHYNIIINFLTYLNSFNKRYVLKGGTALMLCYNLTRFSEDIDLDGLDTDIGELVQKFCINTKLDYRVAKDTPTVKRYFIHYGGIKPLKIEVAYRIKNIDFEKTTGRLNGFLVYNIESLLTMKLSAYNGRDKIRDLYDVVFIALTYWSLLNDNLKFLLRDTLSYKGFEQFEYLVKTQSDELIDNEELGYRFLTLWNNLGL